MDERCKTAHAKLLAGKCPWCGRFVVEGKVDGPVDDKLGEQPPASEDTQFARTLEDYIRSQGTLAIEEAVGMLEAIAYELAHFHVMPRMHGSLRPSNIRLLNGKPILRHPQTLDAKEGQGPYPEDMADYLAPEQALSTPPADRPADVYSLGCVLYFMLVGRPPFATGSVSERLLKHQVEQPASLTAIRKDVPAVLEAICFKMLAKKPVDRYKSAEEVMLAIKSWRNGGL